VSPSQHPHWKQVRRATLNLVGLLTVSLTITTARRRNHVVKWQPIRSMIEALQKKMIQKKAQIKSGIRKTSDLAVQWNQTSVSIQNVLRTLVSMDQTLSTFPKGGMVIISASKDRIGRSPWHPFHATGRKASEAFREQMSLPFDAVLPRWNYRAVPIERILSPIAC